MLNSVSVKEKISFSAFMSLNDASAASSSCVRAEGVLLVVLVVAVAVAVTSGADGV